MMMAAIKTVIQGLCCGVRARAAGFSGESYPAGPPARRCTGRAAEGNMPFVRPPLPREINWKDNTTR
jgi:hypothetical protein